MRTSQRLLWMAGAKPDLAAPTCVITTNAVEPVAAGEYFTITFTFDEDVTGFVVGDITIAGATLSEFTTISASVYTVKATVT